MPFNIQQMLGTLLQNNPQLQQNQNAMQMINALKNNDQKAGEEIANNILKQHGMTREQGMQAVQQFFSQRR